MVQRKIKKPPAKKPKKATKKAVKKTVRKLPKKAIKSKKKSKGISAIKLRKPKRNPIIKPAPEVSWQSKATFNPTALYSDGKVHIVYRAIGDNDVSVLGYANSHDGININERHPEAAYVHETGKKKKSSKKLPKIFYSSGGGWGGGCEDPRITVLDDTVYILYTAFDGWGSVRIALNSISLEDFLAKRWKWDEPVLISPPGELHKNWALFPEKINGKYAILHGISPQIMIEYVDDMDEFDGKKFIKSISHETREREVRERGIRGVGPSPIKTKLGWLVMYHATQNNDPGKYKLWAMILDKNKPEKVLYRSRAPILEPDQEYENSGFKWGVVYSCGAVVKGKDLFVYYGGADMVSCVASANLDRFLEELIKMKEPKLSKRSRTTV